ncbi:MAG: hydroxymethylbilane synthase [Deltaproteobacteria bacterium]|nr:MAG: hydroxymethylbilane synthase [Deltaproteobacteria bacterium]
MKPTQGIRIGTRKSKLALWQAELVADMLNKNGMPSELVTMETRGDKILDVSISAIGSKGVFTEELEARLASGDIDIAVHSAKDMQSTLPDGFEIIAFTRREHVNDVVISRNPSFTLAFADQNPNCPIGTSSVRRTALLKYHYPHARTVDMRGNLQTRIAKMDAGDCDALILAYAGVHRMGYDDLITEVIPEQLFCPAIGQGSIAVEASVGLDPAKRDAIRQVLNDSDAERGVIAERSFLNVLEGGCSVPAFALARLEDNSQLRLTAGIVAPDGSRRIEKTVTGDSSSAHQLGTELARTILDMGGKDILSAMGCGS